MTKICFARKPCSTQFMACEDLDLTPVLPFELCCARSDELKYLNPVSDSWESAVELPSELLAGRIPLEVVPQNDYPKFNHKENDVSTGRSSLVLEEMDSDMILGVLKYRKQMQRYRELRKIIEDEDLIEKRFYGLKIEKDEKNYLYSFTVYFYYVTEDELFNPGEIEYRKEKYEFNIKKGTVEVPDYPEVINFPASLRNIIFDEFVAVVHRFTKIKVNYEKPDGSCFVERMKLITKIPFDYRLAEVIEDGRIAGIKVRINRKKPQIFNSVCKKLKIRNYSHFRYLYQENPQVLKTLVKMTKTGIKDINLYNKVLEDESCSNLFNMVDAKYLKFYVDYALSRKTELSVINGLIRDSKKYYEAADAIVMFSKYYKEIPEKLKKDILEDGFTEFNHDALSKLSNYAKHKNVKFTYTDEEKRLEESVNGYEFKLPQDSYYLGDTGVELHNCVFSYAGQVENKTCTIVVAEKDGEKKICIELRGKKIMQVRADHNTSLENQEADAFIIWKKNHQLVD